MNRKANCKPFIKQETGDNMAIRELFLFCLLFLTLIQWVIYYNVKQWLINRHPEPEQSTAVDRVLYHEITDLDLPWQAGESWQKHGRGYVVALQRQGLYEMLDEHEVNDYRAIYCLGYTVREEQDKKELKALSQRLQRAESHVDELRDKLTHIKQNSNNEPHRASQSVCENQPLDPLTQSWNEWGQCDKGIDELMRAKGWQRINPVSVPVAVPVAVELPEPAEPAEQEQNEYTSLTGDERTAAMIKLKDEGMSYHEIAQLFGVSDGSAKGTISRGRKAKSNVLPLFAGCSEGVREVM